MRKRENDLTKTRVLVPLTILYDIARGITTLTFKTLGYNTIHIQLSVHKSLYIQTHTHTHTHTHKERDTHIETQRHRDTETQTETHTHTHRKKERERGRDTLAHRHRHRHTHTHTHQCYFPLLICSLLKFQQTILSDKYICTHVPARNWRGGGGFVHETFIKVPLFQESCPSSKTSWLRVWYICIYIMRACITSEPSQGSNRRVLSFKDSSTLLNNWEVNFTKAKSF